MYPYRIILCPVDFDDNSLAALRHAGVLAKATDATLHLLHVVTLIPTASDVVQSLEPEGEAPARERLQQIAGRELAGVKHEIQVKNALTSGIGASIVSAARDLGPDLIVMATHGRAGAARFLLGSVAETVIRRAACPVLTVRG